MPFGKSVVNIERCESLSADEVRVRFVPSEDVTVFRYAISEDTDVALFSSGEMEGIVEVEGNGAVEVSFDGLEPDTYYTVYASGCDSDGRQGRTYTLGVLTGDSEFGVNVSHMTHSSVGFDVYFTGDYSRIEYFFGVPGDSAAFRAGLTDSDVLEDIAVQDYTLNFFNLEPSSEHVLFLKGYDRAGSAEYRECHVVLGAEGEVPAVNFEIVALDTYRGVYRLVGNEKVGCIMAMISEEGFNDVLINGPLTWGGDIVGLVSASADLDYPGSGKSTSGELQLVYETYTLQTGLPLEMYVVVTDKDMTPVGVQHFTFATPDLDPALNIGGVSVSVENVTSDYAECVYLSQEGTMGFFYEVLDADWYDSYAGMDPSWNNESLCGLLSSNGFWVYVDDMQSDRLVYKPEGLESGKRYYAAAAPLSRNGLSGGWLTAVTEEFVTSK